MVDGSCAGAKILVVEDEPDIRELVRYNLEQEGFRIVEAVDAEQALAMVPHEKPALLMLDLMLPGMDGLRLCRMLRERPETAAIPIVMLTARAAEIDRVLGLEMGADDYITKPFSPRELVARVRAVLRRSAAVETPPPPERYERGRLRIDFGTYEAWLDGRPLGLSLREFELLKFFVRNPQRVFDRLGILDLVWGQDTYVEPRTVDVHVRRLRVQVERDPAHPELILTVRGVGYKFDDRALETQRQTE
jgi:two-component system, OmpR family, alkaline phosphatase synthesis response regulator PhoP